MSESLPAFMEDEIGCLLPGNSMFHVIPVPWEATVSYGGGTAEGPRAILEASDQLEVWDGYSIPAEKGVCTQAPVDCSGDAEDVLARIEAEVGASARSGAVPVVLGGEHTVTLGALRAIREVHGEFGIVQFDAHADLREVYEGTPYSHACVMHRALEMNLPLFQIGVRALSPPEVELRQRRGVGHIDGPKLPQVRPLVPVLPSDFPEKIYITFDVDGLDASLMPSTGTPVPGGLFWHQAMWFLENIVQDRTVVGMDVVELAPVAGNHGPDFTAAQLVYSMMGWVARSRG